MELSENVVSLVFTCNVCGQVVEFQDIQPAQAELMLEVLERGHKHSQQSLWDFYKSERDNMQSYRDGYSANGED